MQDLIEQRTLEPRDGFDLVAYKVFDTDTDTDDFDCYDKADVKAWREDEWRFVGVVVKASREGIELGEDALYGVEDGYIPTAESEGGTGRWVDAFDHTLGAEEDHYDVPGEAIERAKANLVKLLQTPPRVAVVVPTKLARQAVYAFDDAAYLLGERAEAAAGEGIRLDSERRRDEHKAAQAELERLLWESKGD